MSRRFRLSSFFFLLLTAYCVLPTAVNAQSAAELQNKIDAQSAQIAALEAEIAEFQKQLNALGAQKNTLQSTINTLTGSQKQLASQIQVTQAKIASANLEIERLR